MQPVYSGDVPGLAIPDTIEFAGRLYKYHRTIETILSGLYVPDADRLWPFKESVQNQVDEALHCWGLVGLTAEPDAVLLTDNGRGVDLDTILLLGQSGKRGETDTVGQHGEGEIISFLVALRHGYEKLMASRKWLIAGRMARYNGSGADVLVLDVYETVVPREGTAWYFAGPEAARVCGDAYELFIRHAAFNLGVPSGAAWQRVRAELAKCDVYLPERPTRVSAKLILDEPGALYSRGMHIGNGPWDLALGYNLNATPGRDRAGFAWEHVRDEAEQLWATHADAEAVCAALQWQRDHKYQPQELRFQTGPSAAVAKRGVKLFKERNGIKKLAWATTSKADAAKAADAAALPQVETLVAYYAPPAWLQDVVKHVAEIFTVTDLKALRQSFPQAAMNAVTTLLNLCGMADTKVEGRTIGGEFDGAGDAERIILDPARMQGWSWHRLVVTVLHEAAHVATQGADDCTRRHANAISDLNAKLIEAVAENATAYLAAKAAFVKWTQEA